MTDRTLKSFPRSDNLKLGFVVTFLPNRTRLLKNPFFPSVSERGKPLRKNLIKIMSENQYALISCH